MGARSWYDVVVVGAGLSGLSAAAHLAAGPWATRRVLLVDDGRWDGVERSWAFWSDRPLLLDGAASTSWSLLDLRDRSGESRRLPLRRHRYRLVRSGALRGEVERILRSAPGFSLRRGTASDVLDGAEFATVTVDGERLRARFVLDSRPHAPKPGPVLGFVGREVRVEADRFDSRAVTFLDLRVPPDPGVGFGYVLPFGPRRALVDVVRFLPPGASWARPEQDLTGYLHAAWGVDRPSVVHAEGGLLALGPVPPRREGNRVLAIGRRAGLVRPTTGFGYARIQHDAAAVARSLARAGHPFDLPVAGRRPTWLDAVWMRTAERDPELLQSALVRLFGEGAADPVLDFLDGATSLRDDVALLRRLPVRPFLRTLLRDPALLAVSSPAAPRRGPGPARRR